MQDKRRRLQHVEAHYDGIKVFCVFGQEKNFTCQSDGNTQAGSTCPHYS